MKLRLHLFSKSFASLCLILFLFISLTASPACHTDALASILTADFASSRLVVNRNVSLPVGCTDTISYDGSQLQIQGWAYDLDSAHTALQVHVYIGGPAGSPQAEGHAIWADRARPDVDATFHTGAVHGFDATLSTDKTGLQPIYVYAINVNHAGSFEGTNPLIGITAVALASPDNAPLGSVDCLFSTESAVCVQGWAYDPDCPAAALPIHLSIGAPIDHPAAEVHTIWADASRPDVGAAFETGCNHGFEANLSTSLTGQQMIYVYADALSAAGTPTGSYQLLATETLSIPDSIPRSASAAALLDTACRELGYQGTAADGSGTGDYTKYGDWFHFNGVKWCAQFVSWCADQTALPASVLPRTASTASMLHGSAAYTDWNPEVMNTLQPGDIIFFSSSASSDGVCHTGILTGIDRSGGHILTIEGNTSSDTVRQNTYAIDPTTGQILSGWDGHYICGYIMLPRA